MSPVIFASKTNQLITGGIDFIRTKIINKVKTALKLLVLIFLFNKSKLCIPENSILIKCNPTSPSINGRIKLIKLGKKDVIFVSKKAPKKTLLIHPPGYDYFEVLRSKLHWGQDNRVRKTLAKEK